MKTKAEHSIIADAIHEWHTVYLPCIRNLSHNALKSYGEGMGIYIDFLESSKGVTSNTICGECFRKDWIEEWIAWLKEVRKCSPQTCNHRLSILKNFHRSHRQLQPLVEMMRVFMTMLCSLLTVCSVSAQISRQEGTDGQAAIYRLPLMERAFLCCRYFEGWHSEKHYPYVGWGHKLLPNEKYSARTMTKRDADELLRKDLRKFVAMFRKFGVDSLLLSEISDNRSYSNQNIIPT
jgi:lysozyme